MEAVDVYLGIGSNIGDRHSYINQAIQEVDKIARVISISELYETEPLGFKADQNFINCCIKIRCSMTPHQLLKALREIERELGRLEKSKNGMYKSRTIDLDILFFGDLTYSDKQLVIPHPELHNRSFVIQPLNDIAPELKHPLLNRTIQEIWDGLLVYEKK